MIVMCATQPTILEWVQRWLTVPDSSLAGGGMHVRSIRCRTILGSVCLLSHLCRGVPEGQSVQVVGLLMPVLYAQVDKLMFQLNSDSEGDEESDIMPEEDEGSQSEGTSDERDAEPADMTAAEPDSELAEAVNLPEGSTKLAGSSGSIPHKHQQTSSKQHQHRADTADCSADSQQAALVDGRAAAAEHTLPYEAGPLSLPSASGEQTLPYPAVSDSQVGQADHNQQPDAVDLTHADDTQKLPNMAGSPSAILGEHVSEQSASQNEVAAVPSIASPLGATTPSSPASSSAKKQRQADIRGFLSPRTA